MSLDEAEAFVKSVMQAWMARCRQCGRQPTPPTLGERGVHRGGGPTLGVGQGVGVGVEAGSSFDGTNNDAYRAEGQLK